IEQRGILALAEVRCPKQLRETDDLCPTGRALADAPDGGLEVGGRIGADTHLHEADAEACGGRHRARHCRRRPGLSICSLRHHSSGGPLTARGAGIRGEPQSRMPRMDMSYTPEEEAFRARVREWLEQNVPPPGSLTDDLEAMRAWQRKLHSAGLLAVSWP